MMNGAPGYMNEEEARATGHVQRTCVSCGGSFWSRSGATSQCPVCRESANEAWCAPDIFNRTQKSECSHFVH